MAAGTYTPGSATHLPTDPGETFPILIKEGVSVVGEPFQTNANAPGTVILGSGVYTSPTAGPLQAAVILAEGGSIARLTIRSQGGVGLIAEGVTGSISNSLFSTNKIGLFLIASHLSISNSAITGNETGIQSTAGDTSEIDQNVLSNNTAGAALGVRISDAGPALRQNQITGNPGGGVTVEGGAHPDLGGGGRSDGKNILSCNGGDLINQTDGAIFARNNLWDHAPPTPTDAVTPHGGTIDTLGATLSSPRCG